MKTRHAVCQRVYSVEPVVDFGSVIVCKCLHPGDVISSNVHIEKQIKWNRYNVNPENGQADSVSHVSIIEVGKVEY